MDNYKYKKTYVVLFLLLLMLTTENVLSQNKKIIAKSSSMHEIAFVNSKWKEVLAEAKKSSKFIFVDAYTSWCGPCKLLKSTTFKDEKTALYFNKNFINFTVDMEKEEGPVLAKKWDITAYPSLLFFNAEGEMVLKQVGFVNAETLMEFGRQALLKK
jgi:thioredoxin 1